MQSSAIEMRSPGGEQHVHLAAGAGRATRRGRGGRGRRSSCPWPRPRPRRRCPLGAGAHDVVGDGPDAVGVGDGRSAELLHDAGSRPTMVPRRVPEPPARLPTILWPDCLGRDASSVDSPAVPKATKRERQRQNRECAASRDDGGREAPEAHPHRPQRSAFSSCRSSSSSSSSSSPSGGDSSSRRARRRRSTSRPRATPPPPIEGADDPTTSRARHRPQRRSTPAVLHTTEGDMTIAARRQAGAEDGQQLPVPRPERLLQRHHLPPDRHRLRRPGRRPEG